MRPKVNWDMRHNSPRYLILSLTIKRSKKVHFDMHFGCLCISLTTRGASYFISCKVLVLCWCSSSKDQTKHELRQIDLKTNHLCPVLSLVELELAVLCTDHCLTCGRIHSKLYPPLLDLHVIVWSYWYIYKTRPWNQELSASPSSPWSPLWISWTPRIRSRVCTRNLPLRTTPIWKCKWTSILGFSFLRSFSGESCWVSRTPKARFVFQLAEFLFLARALRAEP